MLCSFYNALNSLLLKHSVTSTGSGSATASFFKLLSAVAIELPWSMPLLKGNNKQEPTDITG